MLDSNGNVISLPANVSSEIDIKNAVYVGDSEVDVATGKNSNLPVIGVLWGFRTIADLDGADIIIDSPVDIVTAVEKLL